MKKPNHDSRKTRPYKLSGLRAGIDLALLLTALISGFRHNDAIWNGILPGVLHEPFQEAKDFSASGSLAGGMKCLRAGEKWSTRGPLTFQLPWDHNCEVSDKMPDAQEWSMIIIAEGWSRAKKVHVPCGLLGTCFDIQTTKRTVRLGTQGDSDHGEESINGRQ